MTEYEAFKTAGCETVADKKRWDAAVAFEREACAKIAESWATEETATTCANIAEAIRRSNAV